MCGIFGVVAREGLEPSVSDALAARLRDGMAHRGPDGSGLWRRANALLAHRRLAVVDLSDAGAQPMVSADGRFVIVYNGELYNDAELRGELASRGVSFRSGSDTETLLEAFATWGTEALARVRGMYAFAVYDTARRLLTLARDPLGVKPLYLASSAREIAFASEPSALLGLPWLSARPNLAMVSAYLTTVRTVLGNDTLFDGVLALGPGEMAQCDLSGSSPTLRIVEHWRGVRSRRGVTEEDAARTVREALTDSVRRHLRADVPTCALLSGGLDSTVVATLAARELGAGSRLRTYCAGAASGEDAGDDLSFARLASAAIGTDHAEAVITREWFAGAWPEMVRRMGTPLSTPNETAIWAVASRLRADGCVVTLSGEGADELLGGYDAPMLAAWEFVERGSQRGAAMSGGRFALESGAWWTGAVKGAMLRPDVWSAVERDAALAAYYEEAFERARDEASGDSGAPSLDAHLRLQRRINLTGLLQRLDTATMLAGVEGRTPFADARVAEALEALPMAAKFAVEAGVGARGEPRARTKIALREAFRGDVPAAIADRPKASFPLPFQTWVADQSGALRSSRFVRALFTDDAVETVAADPGRHWKLAWPMINLALWGSRWWP